MKELVLELTLVFDGSTLAGKSQKPENLRASLRVDSIMDGSTLARKVKNLKSYMLVLESTLAMEGLTPIGNTECYCLFYAGEESTLEDIESTPAQ